jgi:hypothetical protein
MSLPARRLLLSLLVPLAFACSTDLDDVTFGLFESGNSPQLSGAIFTTTSDGTRVDANIYQAKCDVYLNGGPHPGGAAGLPAGDYYFMVTSPSGAPMDPPAVLLSSDSIESRIVTVDDDGVFTSAGHHATSENEIDGGVAVQLCPFATTPNPGCEYKVWLTPVEDYDPTAMNSTFGFVHSRTKTDNFKVCEEEAPPPPPPGEGDDDGSEFDQN